MFKPMPAEYFAEAAKPGIDLQWNLQYWGYDDSEPPREVKITLKYRNDEDVLCGFGYLDGAEERYYFEFPSSQPFFELLAYIGEHPGVFFNHEEYRGESKASVFAYMAGAKESFMLSVGGYHIANPRYRYAIMKKISEETAPEVIEAIQRIKADFVQEIFKHPELIQTPDNGSGDSELLETGAGGSSD